MEAESKMLEKEFLNPSAMGFTNTVTYTANGVKTIYVSGQVGYDENGIPDDFDAQADLAYRNLLKELKSAGADVGDVIKLNAYVKELDKERSKAMAKAKAKYFVLENQPASTMVGVTGLVFPNLLVEIEAIAVIEA